MLLMAACRHPYVQLPQKLQALRPLAPYGNRRDACAGETPGARTGGDTLPRG
jgi:hypothetical protein